MRARVSVHVYTRSHSSHTNNPHTYKQIKELCVGVAAVAEQVQRLGGFKKELIHTLEQQIYTLRACCEILNDNMGKKEELDNEMMRASSSPAETREEVQASDG